METQTNGIILRAKAAWVEGAEKTQNTLVI